jgi:AraC family transcriptional regulator
MATAVSSQRKVWLDTFPAGSFTTDASPHVFVCMYISRPLDLRCSRGGTSRWGRMVAGDLEIIPAHTPSVWEADKAGVRLMICVPEGMLSSVALKLGMNPESITIADRFQVRDPVMEHIGWALKAEVDRAGFALTQSLGTAMSVRLLQRHNGDALTLRGGREGLSAVKLQQIQSYIADNLASKLSIAKLSEAMGASASHLQALFRNGTGFSIHQYVLRKRIEQAQLLLRDGNLSLSQVALASGFAHQSHLARHMRRIIGSSPKSMRKTLVP